MSDLLLTGAQWLRRKLDAHASRSVTYRRGAASVTLTATVGASLLKVASGQYGELQVVRTDRDYTFAAASLILSASLTQPQQGDTIEDATDGRIYEVLAPHGEPPWRYSDNRQVGIRVHCKDVGAL